MTMTIDKEKLVTFYFGKSDFKELSDAVISFKVNLFPYEVSDAEVIELSEKLGMYSFLKDTSEDIYSLSDGSPLE